MLFFLVRNVNMSTISRDFIIKNLSQNDSGIQLVNLSMFDY